MAITIADGVKLNKYLKEHAIGDIYYLDMCDYLGKRGKISDIEFLEYFTDYVVDKFRKSEKISIKQLTKVIFTIRTFLIWIHEAESEIKEDTLDKIRNFKEFYMDFITRNNVNIDLKFNDDVIDSLLKKVEELYPCKGRESNEVVSKYISKISTLEDKIRGLEKELSMCQKQYESLQESYDQKSVQVRTLSSEKSSLNTDLKSKKNELQKLNDHLESLRIKVNDLESQLSKAEEDNNMLSHYKEQYELLESDFIELKKRVESDTKEKNENKRKAVKHAKIETMIYKKLLLDGVSLDELVEYINENGLVSDRNEVADLLRKIKQNINIGINSFSANPTYKVSSPTLLEDDKFLLNIPLGCKHYDVILSSDFHIKEFDQKVLAGFDVLYDYCVKSGINLIFNLGDLYQGFSARPLDYENAVKNYKVVEQGISLIPKVDGIYHAVLGGNHERNIANYGFDPIRMLASEREDFVSLGYKHSTVLLSNSSNFLGSFDLHHPDNFDFPIHLDENGIDIADISNYLNRIYDRQGRNREESYIDLFGHTHRSQFNYPGAYYFLPSFFEGGNKRGACHLRIYFDESTGIKYMVFMPLSFNNNKLVKNNEIIYQKVIKK